MTEKTGMRQNKMKIIGITGGVGAGKSEILRYLREKHDAVIIEADKVGHLVMEPGQECYEQIRAFFGEKILNQDKTIDRGTLGKIVFSDPEQLKKLNSIVHPAVKCYILSEIEKEKQQNTKVYVIEAALLLEDHYDEICDEVWYIHTEKEVRRERLKRSRGYDDEKIAGIMANQKSPEEFKNACQAVIDNSGDLAETCRQIDRQLGR